MQIAPFAVEEWMNRYETQARCNIAETCVDSISLDELLALCQQPRQAFLDQLAKRPLTYGDIVGSPEYLRESAVSTAPFSRKTSFPPTVLRVQTICFFTP